MSQEHQHSIKIPNPHYMGDSYVRLLRTAKDSAERKTFLQSARDEWNKIKRPDLIETIDKEFGANG